MLTMATKQEINRMGGEGFKSFPAWIEMNPRYTCSEYAMRNLLRAVSIDACDQPSDSEPEMYTSNGNFRLDGYGKSWRLWYANGREQPDGKLEWERFSWDKK